MREQWKWVVTLATVFLFVGGTLVLVIATNQKVRPFAVPQWNPAAQDSLQDMQPPVGACCFPDGSCQEMTEDDCTTAGGTLWLEGVPCGPSASWGSDDFEDYEVGSPIAGQGGWETWDDNPDVDAPVSDDFANSGSNSLMIGGTGVDSDIVHQITGATSWTWTAQAYAYVPSTQTGDFYYIMLNEYNHGGPWNWTVQLRMSAIDGVIEDELFGNSLPLATDQWAEILVDIDLDLNLHSVFYNGDPLYIDLAWNAWSGGPLEIAAFDLYSFGSSDAYYDDVSLIIENDPNPCPQPSDEDEDND